MLRTRLGWRSPASYAVAPQNSNDAHRPVLHSERELTLTVCLHHNRTLPKHLTLTSVACLVLVGISTGCVG